MSYGGFKREGGKQFLKPFIDRMDSVPHFLSLELICISNNTGFKNYVMPCELPNYLPYNSYWNLLGVSFAGTGRFVSVDALTGRKSEETTVALLKQPGA